MEYLGMGSAVMKLGTEVYFVAAHTLGSDLKDRLGSVKAWCKASGDSSLLQFGR